MIVVLGQGDDVPFGGDFEAAAPGHLDLRALILRDQLTPAIVDRDMELVAMRVADEDVARVRDVDAVGEGGDWLAPDLAHEPPLFIDYNDTVGLKGELNDNAFGQ